MKCIKYLISVNCTVCLCMFFVSLFYFPNFCNAKDYKILNDIDYAEVYFTLPKFAINIPYDKNSIESEADHQIIIGNREKINELIGLFNRIFKISKSSEGLKDNLRFKINIVYLNRKESQIYIDLVGNYEFVIPNNIILKGQISGSDFNRFINYCKSISSIIDLEFQRQKLLQYRPR